MIAALIAFLMFGIFWFWIALIKNLRAFKKGEVRMPIYEFVFFCILTFIIVTPLLFIVCTLLDDICFHHIIRDNNGLAAFAMVICLLIVTVFLLWELKAYRKKFIRKPNKTKENANYDKSSKRFVQSKGECTTNIANKKEQDISIDNTKHLSVDNDKNKDIRKDSPTAFIESFTLMDFAKLYGPKMQVGTFTNNATQENYKACLFTDKNGLRTYVAFSSTLGELTPLQIADQKEELMVGKLQSGKFILYDSNWQDWKEVDLGL